jgi:hypothetical protein
MSGFAATQGPQASLPEDPQAKGRGEQPEETNDDTSAIANILYQAVFLFVLLCCQHPELAVGPISLCYLRASEFVNRFKERLAERQERRARRYEPLHDEARTPTRSSRLRITLHPKLARFQSRLNNLAASTTVAAAPDAASPTPPRPPSDVGIEVGSSSERPALPAPDGSDEGNATPAVASLLLLPPAAAPAAARDGQGGRGEAGTEPT